MRKQETNKDENSKIGDDSMNAAVIESGYKKVDYKSLLKNKRTIIVSSQEALKDVVPIEWSEDVLSGKTKIVIDNEKKK